MNDFYSTLEIEDNFLLEPDGSYELVKNAVPFAMSENGEFLIWDILNPDKNGEFPIYLISSRMGGIHFAGKDLLDFITSCVDENKIKQFMGSGYKKLPFTFEPLTI